MQTLISKKSQIQDTKIIPSICCIKDFWNTLCNITYLSLYMGKRKGKELVEKGYILTSLKYGEGNAAIKRGVVGMVMPLLCK